MLALASELLAATNSSEVRSQAGLQLKQCLTSKDELVDQQLSQFWIALDEEARQTIRNAVIILEKVTLLLFKGFFFSLVCDDCKSFLALLILNIVRLYQRGGFKVRFIDGNG